METQAGSYCSADNRRVRVATMSERLGKEHLHTVTFKDLAFEPSLSKG